MKHGNNPKKARKQAEESILRDMRKILDDLEQHRAKQEEVIDKEQVMTVLTRFMDLKRAGKLIN